MSNTVQHIKTASRARRSHIRVNPFSWLALIIDGRRDARAGVPHVLDNAQDGTVATPTSVVRRIATRAEEQARVEGIRFAVEVESVWRQWDAGVRDLRQQREELRKLLDEAGARPDEVHGERLRRLQRRINAIQGKQPTLSAAINGSMREYQLRASRYFDYSDHKVGLYWRTLRRRHINAHGIADEPPLLRRPDWLSAADGTEVIQAWNSLGNQEERD